MSIVEVFPAVGAQEGHDLAGADGQCNASHGLHRAEMLVHVPQVDGRRPAGTILTPRQRSRLRIVPGHLHLTVRRPGQRPGVLTHPGWLCRATTMG
jgi:hypothetical protein